MSAYYNDSDPFVCAWARNLIAAGLVADGEVDERPIQEIQPRDLDGFDQCHFFAGIGGWSHTLRLAGWPDDRPCWTGSVPCQPLSGAGLRNGHADKRHLWPAFHCLIAERKPATIFGEQVASKDGREWLAGVRADLEDLGYAVGAADLCAASVGAPHIRQRLWWMAHADGWRCERPDLPIRQQRQDEAEAIERGVGGRLADADRGACGQGRSIDRGRNQGRDAVEGAGPGGGREFERRGQSDFWSGSELIPCLDGKARRVEPTILPLAHGIPNRMGLLRGAGNSICPQLAAEFVRAVTA